MESLLFFFFLVQIWITFACILKLIRDHLKINAKKKERNHLSSFFKVQNKFCLPYEIFPVFLSYGGGFSFLWKLSLKPIHSSL